MRNKEMTIFKALGIMAVVMGHSGYSVSKTFPPYSFHMALFIFASGYFYKDEYEENLKLFFKKRFKSIIVPYFLYNLFFAVVTYLIFIKYNLSLGTPPDFNNMILTLKNFFVQPFIDGHQYFLYLSAWFMIYLFTVQIAFILFYKSLKKITLNKHIHLIIFTLIAIISTYASINFRNIFTGTTLIIVQITLRLMFGLFFFYFGLFYKTTLENKNMFRTSILILIIIIQLRLIRFWDINYTLVFMDFKGHVLLPLITSLTGIYVYMFLAKALCTVLPNKDILYNIGDNTLHIMSNHLFVFFILNIFIVKIYNVDIINLNDVSYKFNIDSFWPIYFFCGVLIPTYIPVIFKKVTKPLYN